MFNTRIMHIKRLRFDHVHDSIVAKEELVSLDKLIQETLINESIRLWRQDLDRETAKQGEGGNKLRTYAEFKTKMAVEPYLIHVQDVRKRALLFKLRSGIALLRIETGRYKANNQYRTSERNSNTKGDITLIKKNRKRIPVNECIYKYIYI